MIRVAALAATVCTAYAFGWLLSLAQLFDILQPLIVALSIMAAALLVRLNRGMPTLDWKSLDSSERKALTGKIVELAREYIVVLAVHFVTLFLLLVLASNKTAAISVGALKVLMTATGALVGLSVIRMAYIVWRDYDIVKLQKKLIDESADREAQADASKEALAKVAAMRASGLHGRT
jgi:hypothetical protein